MTQQMFCRKPFEWFELEASADYAAFLCCSGWLRKSIGSVAAADPMEVWNSVAAQEIRESILDGNFRFCDRDRCSALQEGADPVMPVDEVTDSFLLDIIRNRKTKLDSGPKVLNCSYDPSCNLQCPTCRNEKIVFSGAEAVPIGRLQDRLLNAFLPGLEWLYVTGSGDPVGSPTFLNLLQTRDLSPYPDLKLHLHTNAQLLTPRRWESLRPNIEKVRTIEVSIDAGTAETYSVNRPPGRWDRLVENMDLLGSRRRKGDLELLRISYVVQANNWREMKQFAEWGSRWAADEVLFARLTNWGTFTEEEFQRRAVHLPGHPDHDQFVEQLHDEIYHREPVRLGNLLDLVHDGNPILVEATIEPTPATRMDSQPVAPVCDRPWTGFHVDTAGTVRPCAWAAATCGSLTTEKPDEIWRGAGFQHFRAQMRAGNHERVCSAQCPVLSSRHSTVEWNDGMDLCTPRHLNGFAVEDSPELLKDAEHWIAEHWLSGAADIELQDGAVLVPDAAAEWHRRLGRAYDVDVTLRLQSSDNPNAVVQWVRSTPVSRLHVHVPGEDGDTRRFTLTMEQITAWRATENPSLALELGLLIGQQTRVTSIESFLELCARYRARPVFIQGSETPDLALLEATEKHVANYGHSIETLAPILAAAANSSPRHAQALDVPRMVYFSGNDRSCAALIRARTRTMRSRGGLIVRSQAVPDELVPSLRDVMAADLGEPVIWSSRAEIESDEAFVPELEIELTDCDFLPTILARAERIRDYGNDRGELRICFKVNRALSAHWTTLLDALRDVPIEAFGLTLPYFDDGLSVSGLDYAETIERVIRDGRERGWQFTYGRPDLRTLGLVEGNQYPRVDAQRFARSRREPEVSIIVPVYDRAASLSRFCASLQQQASETPMEVVFVDDGSTDGSREILDAKASELSRVCDVAVLHLEREIAYRPYSFTFRAGAARQIGIENSRGRHVVFVDPDQILESHSIASLAFFARQGFDVVIGCRDIGHEPPSVPVWTDLSAWKYKNDSVGQREFWWTSFFTGNALVSRELLTAAGGFDESLQLWGLEDIDLAFRLARLNARVFHTLRSRVYHDAGYLSGGGDGRQMQRMQRLGMEVLYRKYFDREVLDAFRWLWGGDSPTTSARELPVGRQATRWLCPVCGWKGPEWSDEGDCPTCLADARTRLLAMMLERLRARRWPGLRVIDLAEAIQWPADVRREFALRAIDDETRDRLRRNGTIPAGSSVFHVILASSRMLDQLSPLAHREAWNEFARISTHDGIVLFFGSLSSERAETALSAGWEPFRVDSIGGATRIDAEDELPLWVIKRVDDRSHLPI